MIEKLSEIKMGDCGYIIIGKYEVVKYNHRSVGGLWQEKDTYHVFIPMEKRRIGKGKGYHGLGYTWGNHLNPKRTHYDTLADALSACK